MASKISGDPKAPLLVATLDDASLPVDAVAVIYDLPRALDDRVTPAHAVFAVETLNRQRFRVSAGELRRIFGVRRQLTRGERELQAHFNQDDNP